MAKTSVFLAALAMVSFVKLASPVTRFFRKKPIKQTNHVFQIVFSVHGVETIRMTNWCFVRSIRVSTHNETKYKYQNFAIRSVSKHTALFKRSLSDFNLDTFPGISCTGKEWVH